MRNTGFTACPEVRVKYLKTHRIKDSIRPYKDRFCNALNELASAVSGLYQPLQSSHSYEIQFNTTNAEHDIFDFKEQLKE